MAFDWQSFLNQHGVEFSERGPSTAKGNLYIHCPFCGSGDQGRHMGVSLEGKGWGCWRDARHRGKGPARLIQALLGCSWAEAERMGGGKARAPGGISGLLDVVGGLLQGKRGESPPPKPLALPRAWKALQQTRSPHWLYLLERGFSNIEIKCLIRDFNLHMTWAESGGWAWRVIIPVYDERGEILTWTGRAVGDAKIRYKTLSPDAEKGDRWSARCAISDCLLNAQYLHEGGDVLVITEGPFDCMRLSLEAPRYNTQVTCLFGKNISAAQIDTLVFIRHRFKHVVLTLDPDAFSDSLRMARELSALGVQFYRLPGKKDPGDMTADEASFLLEQISNEVFGKQNFSVESTHSRK